MPESPTSRTLKLLRARGYEVDVVERWIPQARVRKDLFGLFDLVALRCGVTHGVQCTSASNIAARRQKMVASDKLHLVLRAHWLVWVVGWRKNSKGRWVHTVEQLGPVGLDWWHVVP